MAKGQMRSTREGKKPKADKKEKSVSAYASAYKSKPSHIQTTPPKKGS